MSLRASQHSGGQWSNHRGTAAWIQAHVPRQAGVSSQSSWEHIAAKNKTLSQAHNSSRSDGQTQQFLADPVWPCTWRVPKTVRALCTYLTQECRMAGTELPVIVGLVSSSLTRQALKRPLLITCLWTQRCPVVRCLLANPRLRGASRVVTQTQAFCGRTNCPSWSHLDDHASI